MNKKWMPRIIAVGAFVVFIVLGACASSSDAVKTASSVDEVTGIKNKLAWLKKNAQSGGNYILEVNKYEDITFFLPGPLGNLGCGDLVYKDKKDITITIKGVEQQQTLRNAGEPGYIFKVGSGVTLILDENIKLTGSIRKGSDIRETRAVVVVSSGGTLIMNDGSTITGGAHCGNGGGVYVDGGGTFLMKGGTITGNFCFLFNDYNSSLLELQGGSYKGAGVYVDGKTTLFGKTSPGGTFTKTGGTIYGYTPDDPKSNKITGLNGEGIIPNSGHAVFAGNTYKETNTVVKRKETTAGPDVNLHYSDDSFSGAWDY